MTLALVLVAVLIVLAVLVFGLVTSLGVALIGWVLSLLFPLSVFEGAIVGLLSSVGAGYVLARFVLSVPLVPDVLDEDEDWEDEDDEPAPAAAPQRPHRTAQAAPKPVSRKKGRRR